MSSSRAEMPFLDHLEELRWRIIWSLAAVLAGSAIGIFLVGYNDVKRLTVDSPDLPAMVEQSAALDCAVWLTLPSLPGGEPAGHPDWDPDRFDAWNARLTEEVEGHPNVHLVSDWRALVTKGDPDELLTEDHIHPSDAGSRRLADAMARAVERSC